MVLVVDVWQGLLRTRSYSDQTKKARPWDPRWDTRRGRITIKVIMNKGGRKQTRGKQTRVEIRLKPTKMDQAGDEGFVKVLVVNHHP